MSATQVGKQLKHYRVRAGYTQAQLAEVLEKSTQHITQIERGQGTPSLSMLCDICRVLELPADALLMGSEADAIQSDSSFLATLEQYSHEDLIQLADVLLSVKFAMDKAKRREEEMKQAQ
ncbi:MAG: helix-turn-helix domain-containing protein [Clostridiales bacterium]|nr:helix-turn-helix domain-containing protein [Clostridiales bacterium]